MLDSLDLSYLLGSLAFFLIAGLTLILNRRTGRLLPWTLLGGFAVCRGIYEALSLPVFYQMNLGQSLMMITLALLLLALICMLEFGRRGGASSDGPVPWWWVYTPLAVLVVVTKLLGTADILGTLVLSVSVVASGWAFWALWQAREKFPQGKAPLTAAGIIMVLFALASLFVHSPLVRGLLALALAVSLGYLCHLAMERVQDPRVKEFYRFLSSRSGIGLILIAVVGLAGCWGSNYLGGKAANDTLTHNQRTIQLIQEIINLEMEKADHLVQLLAGSARVVNALSNSSDFAAVNAVNLMLDRYSQTEEGYGVYYIMNPGGTVISSSNRNQPDSFLGKNYGFRPYFKAAALGLQGRYFALGVTSNDLGYYSSAPVRNERGVIVGAAIIKRMIRTSGELRNAFDPESVSLLVDPHGIVVLSNHSSSVLQSLWPLDEGAAKEVVASQQFGKGPFPAILDRPPTAGKNYQIFGRRMMLQTQPTLMEGWTLYHFGSAEAISFYRLIGLGAILILGLALIAFYVIWDFTSYQAIGLLMAGPLLDDGFLPTEKGQEALPQGEVKFQGLLQHIGLVGEMGDLLQGCRSSQEAVPVMVRYLERLFPDLSGAIYLASDSGAAFEAAGEWGEAPPAEMSFVTDDCWALRRGRQYQVDDPGTSLLCHHLPANLPAGYQCWPIVAQGMTLGIFHLRWNRQPKNNLDGSSKEVTRQLVSTVVEQIALTLVNLKLRETSKL